MYRSKSIIIILIAICVIVATVAQAQIPPQGFNYSAVARDSEGKPVSNSNIGIQISILRTSITGPTVYSENHSVNTDPYGLFNLIVGGGSVQSGSMDSIAWSEDSYFLKVGLDINGGSNYLTMGTTQFLSVPYALHSKTASNGIDHISPGGDTLYLSNGQFFISGSIGASANLVLPTIQTDQVTNITSNSATCNGNISNANGNQIIERGFVYSLSPNPTIYSNRITVGSGIGTYQKGLGLTLVSDTTYYIRAYAISENNITAYGSEVSFSTLPTGQIGPGGGIIFFDNGNNSGGWQYLEAAPEDQVSSKWGCYGTQIGGLSCAVGDGKSNTAKIVSGCSEADIAAKVCNNLVLGGLSDWFLPSNDELNLMYINLKMKNLGNLSGIYWSSCEYSPNHAFYFDFSNGEGVDSKNNLFSVRAVRSY